MNPELRRNLWLELTEQRVITMTLAVTLIIGLAIVSGDLFAGATTAQTLFYGIVILWGTRSAADCVAEEIIARTWDFQRLSAIHPWTMVWGKLLGATSLAWLGGAMCLTVVLYHSALTLGPAALIRDLIYYLGIGLFAHAVAMMASLVAIRRALTRNRFGVFLYQCAGLFAALVVWRIWQSIDPNSLMSMFGASAGGFLLEAIDWWGLSIPTATFYVASLIAFAAWTLTANYRLMRAELQVQNGPLVWLAFLAFIAVYAAGFDGWQQWSPSPAASMGLRALQATLALGVFVYVMALVEPKDVVTYRRVGRAFMRLHLVQFVWHLPRWIYALLATFAAGGLAAAYLPFGLIGKLLDMGEIASAPYAIIAGLGFLTRDCAILVGFGLGQTGRRSDIAALAMLGMLYLFVPALLGSTEGPLSLLFYPSLSDPAWVSPAIAWAQALIGWVIVLQRRELRMPELRMPERS
jgi:hypothetical protein